MIAKEYPDFITITCLEWKYVLADNRFKEIVIRSMKFLVAQNRVAIYAFCIMDNHLHMIWQMKGDHLRVNVQRDFLKYTSQQILKILIREQSPILETLIVNALDRKYQIWERNSLSVPLYSDNFFDQKFAYIHRNPVAADMCRFPEDYPYSSAAFYFHKDRTFDFLTHYKGE